MDKLLNRILIGFALLGLALASIYFGPVTWALVILVFSLLAYREFKFLCNNLEIYPLDSWIRFFVVLFILCPLLLGTDQGPSMVYTFLLTTVIAAYVIIFPRILLKADYTHFGDVTASLWAVFQFGLLPSFFTWIRMMDQGMEFTMLMILTISANDVGSLFIGKWFGREQLAPKVSPKKTVLGSIGGLVSAALAFYGFGHAWGFELTESFLACPYYQALDSVIDGKFAVFFVLGLLFAIVAQIGDLMVSALKRAAGVKDSGTLLFSHGGVLDRIDSHFFAVWFAYFIFAYLIAG
ncbi:MAG: phosphatidate cytidylyltransferase [Candidatus Melainabacteria bacterium]|nr:phosphatidate cytidylyltransferase [Candidatus Melainabacteria bacterium]